MKYIFAFIIIMNILACRSIDTIPAWYSDIVASDTVMFVYDGNDSIIYKATYRRSSLDSVRKGLSESAHPIREQYIPKY